MKTLSLGLRVTLLTISTSLAAVIAILLLAYNGVVRDFEEVLTQRQLLETESAARIVDQELQIRLEALTAFSSFLTDGDRLLPNARLAELLGRPGALNQYFPAGLLVFDNNGVAIAENRYVPNRIGTSYADRPHFRDAIRTRQALVSRPIIGRTTGLPLLSFLAPVETDDGDLLGLAGGVINLAESGIIPESLGQEDGVLFKVLDTGHFTQVDSLRSGLPMPDLPGPGNDAIIDAALSGITTGIVKDSSGKRWVYATKHLDRVGWLFLRAEPYERVTGPARASFSNFLQLSVLVILGISFLAWVLAKTLTRPLETMSLKIRDMIMAKTVQQRLKPKGPPETRNLAKAFNQLMEELESLDTMKDKFVSTVSHELRTPLTSINGSLKLLKAGTAGELPEKAENLITIALRNSDQLQLLISDLLDFNKAIAGQLSVYPARVKVATALSQAVEGNLGMAQNYGVECSCSTHPRTQSVWADAQRLRQILDNFLSNAIKFSPEGGTVRILGEPTDYGMVRITVSDQGKGVPEGFLPRLFDRFAQADSASRQSRSGTGLGLAICRELAELMDGEIGYYYRDGAHFWVELPCPDQDTEEAHENT
ncbi:ATP-binding protein [Marinobacter sp. VGCF2001]|uniref:ATP-binding protein n=1 Tax=Marinobacter sp. VGCF2001 TaxID=3417189 RepID=UPI003CE6C524